MQRKTGQKEHAVNYNQKMRPITITAIEKAKSVLPIYGGTNPEGGTSSEGGTEKKDEKKSESKSDSSSSSSSGNSSSQSAGGGSENSNSNSGSGDTEQQVADLLRQVSELNNKVTSQSTELEGYRTKEQEAQRAAMSEQDRLKSDLESLGKTVEKMDQVIHHLAMINAIQGFKDAEFHEARQVLMELREGDYNFDVDIDLENGQATVSGIEDALKKIAKDKYWLVKNAANGSNGNGSGGSRARGSGAAPGSPSNTTTGEARRAEMIKKFPVIAAGRGGMSR